MIFTLESKWPNRLATVNPPNSWTITILRLSLLLKNFTTLHQGPWHSVPCVLNSFVRLISQRNMPTKLIAWYQWILYHLMYFFLTQFGGAVFFFFIFYRQKVNGSKLSQRPLGKLEWVSCLSRHAMSGSAVSHPYMTYLWLNIVWRLRLPLTDMESVKQKLLRSDRLFSLSNYSADTFAKHIPQIQPATFNPLTHLCMFCTCESEVKSLSFLFFRQNFFQSDGKFSTATVTLMVRSDFVSANV